MGQTHFKVAWTKRQSDQTNGSLSQLTSVRLWQTRWSPPPLLNMPYLTKLNQQILWQKMQMKSEEVPRMFCQTVSSRRVCHPIHRFPRRVGISWRFQGHGKDEKASVAVATRVRCGLGGGVYVMAAVTKGKARSDKSPRFDRLPCWMLMRCYKTPISSHRSAAENFKKQQAFRH